MNEVPVTRIVPQKQNDTLHLTRPASRSHSRASSYTPIPTAWDTRSIATQTSQEEEQQQQTRNGFLYITQVWNHELSFWRRSIGIQGFFAQQNLKYSLQTRYCFADHSILSQFSHIISMSSEAN